MLKSELKKLYYSRGFTIALSVMAALNIAICWLIAHQVGTADLSLIAAPWEIAALFILSISVIHVTSEYAYNTMRTTVLISPKRSHIFFAKLAALTIYVVFWLLVLLLTSAVAIWIAAPDSEFILHGTGQALFGFAVSLVAISWMSAGLGFLLRSTAFAIVCGIALLFITTVLYLIPLDFFQTTYQKFVLDNAIGQIVATDAQATDFAFAWGGSFAVVLGYPIVFGIAGLLRFTTSDV